MSDELDHMMAAARGAPHDRLDGLEGRVWKRIDHLRQSRRASALLIPLRAASVVAALGAGMIGGSHATSSAKGPAEISAFSLNAHLAPSTLLDGR